MKGRMRKSRTAASGTLSPRFGRMSPASDSQDSMYFDAQDELPASPSGSDGEAHGNDFVAAFSASLQRLTTKNRGSSMNDRERQAALERQVSQYVEQDAVIQPELPARCLPPLFSGDIYSKRFVRLSRPPAGMSMLAAPAHAQVLSQLEAAPSAGAGDATPMQNGGHESEALHAARVASSSAASSSKKIPFAAAGNATAESFMIRSLKYTQTKKKQGSEGAIYQFIAADLYAFDFKLSHIAKHVLLPPAPNVPDQSHLPADEQIPPLLVVNIQLPGYPASLWGSADGTGASLVYYFGLPEGWTPDHVPNKAALGLLRRLVHNKHEADKTPTRDRLKLIARVVNVDEWAKTGPLSGYEVTLLRKYNDKPIMTRPQHKFFTGPNYLEVDLDVHQWAYLARKAFGGFINRLSTVVFENALVIQGNREEELPEQILAAAQMRHVDFSSIKPFPADTLEHASISLRQDGMDKNNPSAPSTAPVSPHGH